MHHHQQSSFFIDRSHANRMPTLLARLIVNAVFD
jgi:hypothetical protein